jgi:hypothetical protein
MKTVNINRRDSIEGFYPRDAFDHDARQNSEAKITVLHGIRILSAPDENGDVQVARTRHHVSENAPDGDALFLAPYMGDDNARFMESETDYGRPIETDKAAADGAAPYADFIDRIVSAVRNNHFQRPIGRGEERLKGFHGG